MLLPPSGAAVESEGNYLLDLAVYCIAGSNGLRGNLGCLSLRRRHISPMPTSGESEGRTATKAFRKWGFTLA